MKWLILAQVFMVLAAITVKLWVFGSLAVSSVKAISNNCGHTYPVEVFVINGDWFCFEEKGE